MKQGLKNNTLEQILPAAKRRNLDLLDKRGVKNIKSLVSEEKGVTTVTLVGEYANQQYVITGLARRNFADQPNKRVGIPIAVDSAVGNFMKLLGKLDRKIAGGR